MVLRLVVTGDARAPPLPPLAPSLASGGSGASLAEVASAAAVALRSAGVRGTVWDADGGGGRGAGTATLRGTAGRPPRALAAPLWGAQLAEDLRDTSAAEVALAWDPCSVDGAANEAAAAAAAAADTRNDRAGRALVPVALRGTPVGTHAIASKALANDIGIASTTVMLAARDDLADRDEEQDDE